MRPHDVEPLDTHLDGHDRRRFLLGVAGGPLGLGAFSLFGDRKNNSRKCCRGDDPLGCIRQHKWNTLVAFLEAQLHCLWCGPPGDSPQAVACDVMRFLEHTARPMQHGMCLVLSWIDFYSRRQTGWSFDRLSLARRRQLLNQGEYRPLAGETGGRALPLITWDDDYLMHTALGSVSILTRMVTNSREPARRLAGFTWSPQCLQAENLVRIEPPPYPDLNEEFDVCVIGSGAGGAVVAARAAEAGQRVLIVEEGEWISPDALTERVRDEQGNELVWPARDDVGLIKLMRGAGVQMSGMPSAAAAEAAMTSNRGHGPLAMRRKMKTFEPRTTVNLLQAKVVGGGPYINNAIHLELEQQAWENWGERRPQGVDYAAFNARMQKIKRELAVSPLASEKYSGERTQAFIDACNGVDIEAKPLPVSILTHRPGESTEDDGQSCAACGSDNIVDPFGQHIGGLHPYNKQGPNSYLMRALVADAPAEIAYEMRAVRFAFDPPGEESHRVAHLVAEDRRGVRPGASGCQVTIRAKKYVLAAGSIGSTRILQASTQRREICIRELGERFSANVVTAVYAVFDQPVRSGESARAEPGVAQCYYVERKTEGDSLNPVEPALENWFHYPGSLAIALTGWFEEYAAVMRKYDHLSLCGLVVPTKTRPENRIAPDGSVKLELDREEFELMLAGLRKIARIYLAAATPGNGVTIYLPTRAILLNRCERPVRIRSEAQLEWAIEEIRRRGPPFLNLATAHPQGGNPLGGVVHRDTFRVQDHVGRQVNNLYVSDASVFPEPCEINPQLTLKGLAMYAADSLLGESDQEGPALVGGGAAPVGG